MSASSVLTTFRGARILQQTSDTLLLLASATAEDLDWQPLPDR